MTSIPKTARQQQKDKTRDTILSVSKQLFLESGFENTTTRQIADKAGVALGTIFAHFRDKHQLLRELLASDVDHVRREARSTLEKQAGSVDAMIHYARHLYAYYQSHWTLSQVLLKEAIFNTEEYAEHLEIFVKELSDRVSLDAPTLSKFLPTSEIKYSSFSEGL